MMMAVMMMKMMMVMTMIDALASNDPSSGDDGSLLASSPSGCLYEVMFRVFLVALCLTSQNQLHGRIIFDEVH
jgi:hypothetical protein